MAAPAPEISSFLKNLHVDSLWVENDVTACLVLLAAVAVGLMAGWLSTWFLRRLAQRDEARGRTGRAQIVRDLAGPARLALFTVGLAAGLAYFRMSQPLHEIVSKTLRLLGTIVALWYAYNLVDIIEAAMRRLRRGAGAGMDRQVVLLVSRSLRVFVLVIAALVIAESVFEQAIGPWLTGLGIAGLAVSLAAQDSLKQFFGSIAILLDRAFHIGDEIIACGYDGTIEDIGFRSTKIRTAAGHLVTIPNANLANNPIENVSRRAAVRRVITLLVAGRTPAEKLHEALRALQDVFAQEDICGPVRPVVDGVACPPQVQLEDIQGSDFRLSISYWYAPATDPDYAAHAERVTFQIITALQQAGVELAQPLLK